MSWKKFDCTKFECERPVEKLLNRKSGVLLQSQGEVQVKIGASSKQLCSSLSDQHLDWSQKIFRRMYIAKVANGILCSSSLLMDCCLLV